MREDWAAAQKQFEAWFAAEPKNIAALQQIAHCLYLQKNADGALEKLREAAKIDPELLASEAILAQFCVQANEREEAKKWVTAALAAAPKDTRIHLFAAQLALDNQQFDEAKAEAEATLKLDPKSIDAKIVLGVAALFQKDYKNAEMYFESAHLQVPTNFQAGNYLALALVEQKDEAKKRKALEYAEANVRQFQKSPDAIATYGWVLYKLGRLDEAEQALRAAASSGNLKPETAFYLARLAVDRGRQPEAKQLLEAALSSGAVFPQREEAQALMGQLK
jgi:tetratricopeptide (TPR) repeat protein